MKKKGTVAILVSLCVGIVFWTQWFGGVARAGKNVDMTSATNISIGSTGSGTISTEGEDAWYKFTTTDKNAFYTIAATTTTAEKDFSIDLVDAEGGSIDSASFNSEEGATMCYKLLPKTTYYIQVVMGDTETVGKFAVKVTTTLDDFNDTLQSATELSVGTVISGRIEAGADKDCMKITTKDTSSYYEISFTNTELEDGVELKLYDSKEEVMEEILVEKGETQNIAVKLLKNSNYYVEIFATNEEAIGNYSLKATMKSDNAGDTKEEATEIKYSTATSGDIEIGSDEDFYKFTTLDLDTYYSISATNKDLDGTINVALMSGDGLVLEEMAVYKGDTETIVYKLEKGTTYYAQITSTDGETTGAYSFMVLTLVDDGADTMEQATALQFGKKIEGRIEVATDVDYYSFVTATEESFYNFLVVNIDSEEDILFDVLQEDGTSISSLLVENTEDNEMILKLEANKKYYFVVSGTSDGQSGNYSFQVDMVKDNAGDTIETASEIALGKAYSGKFETAEDVDVVRFTTLKTKQFYDFSFVNKNVTESISMEIVDKDGVSVGSIEVANASSEKLTLKLEPATTYYMEMSGAGELGSYSYKVVNVADEGDTFDTASEASLDKEIKGAIYLEDDVDYCKVKTNTIAKKYTFSFVNNATEDVMLAVKLMDSTGATLAEYEVEKGKNVKKTFSLKQKKYYYVSVESNGEKAEYTWKLAGGYTNPKTVKLNKTKLTLKKGKTATLKVKVTPKNAVIKTQKWTSSKTKIATVSKKGVVKAKKKGSTNVKCKVTFYGGKTKTVSCKVTVK